MSDFNTSKLVYSDRPGVVNTVGLSNILQFILPKVQAIQMKEPIEFERPLIELNETDRNRFGKGLNLKPLHDINAPISREKTERTEQ